MTTLHGGGGLAGLPSDLAEFHLADLCGQVRCSFFQSRSDHAVAEMGGPTVYGPCQLQARCVMDMEEDLFGPTGVLENDNVGVMNHRVQ